MKQFLLLLFLGSSLLLQAQTNSNKWISPPFTSVDKLAKVRNGMSIQDVNTTLGIPPYNIQFLQQEGGAVLTYNYRLQLRKNKLPTTMQQQEDYMRGESGQTGGDIYYDPEYYQAYMLFKDGKMSSLVTSEGLKRSEYILLMNNNLKLLSKDDYRSLNMKRNGDAYLINNKDTVFLFRTLTVPDAPKAEPAIHVKKGNGAGLIKACGTIVLLGGVIALIAYVASM